MKNLKERIAEVSESLQQLTESSVFPEVQNAVENKDKDLVVEVCRKIKVPEIYISDLVSLLFAMSSRQPKWPAPQY